MTKPIFTNLMEFLQKLEEADIYYALAHHHDEAIMVEVALTGERWEVEFSTDGSVTAERFVRDDALKNDEAFETLLGRVAEEDSETDSEEDD